MIFVDLCHSFSVTTNGFINGVHLFLHDHHQCDLLNRLYLFLSISSCYLLCLNSFVEIGWLWYTRVQICIKPSTVIVIRRHSFAILKSLSFPWLSLYGRRWNNRHHEGLSCVIPINPFVVDEHQIGLIYFIQYLQLLYLWNAFGRPTRLFHGRFAWYSNGILEFCICLVMT